MALALNLDLASQLWRVYADSVRLPVDRVPVISLTCVYSNSRCKDFRHPGPQGIAHCIASSFYRQLEVRPAQIPCYSGRRASTSLYKNVDKKRWTCEDTRSAPEIAQSGYSMNQPNLRQGMGDEGLTNLNCTIVAMSLDTFWLYTS